MAHYLVSWGDALTFGGDYLSIQPMILPLFGGLSEIEVLNALLGGPKTEGPELVQETFRATKPPGDFATAWSKFLRDGFAPHVKAAEQSPAFNADAARTVAHNLWSPLSMPTFESPEIVLVGSYAVDDGRYINNGWLQEMPDPVTKLTWDNGAMMSPVFAQKLGVETGDLVQISVAVKSAEAEPVTRELII